MSASSVIARTCKERQQELKVTQTNNETNILTPSLTVIQLIIHQYLLQRMLQEYSNHSIIRVGVRCTYSAIHTTYKAIRA